ncbi:MAG: thioredoxin TrxC [Bacteriovoracaceae bacterium]|nr:thioredoxin TrxC [Bacteriovoracaceae bacterium]
MSHTFTTCPKCQALNKVQSEKALKSEAICGQCQTKLNFHGLVSEVNSKDFQRIVNKSDIPVVVDFWASWCGPCKSYGPQFQQASSKSNAVFLKINTETEQALSSQFGIRGIPCTLIFKNGKEVARQSGAMSSDQLIQWIARN